MPRAFSPRTPDGLSEPRTLPRRTQVGGSATRFFRLERDAGRGLERLLAAAEDDWHHPTEILGRPCPDFSALLTVALARPEIRNGDRRHLESVREKLARAASLEATARRRREGGS